MNHNHDENRVLEREFSSGGIVMRKKGRSFYILLIKDSYGRWTWPKGHIDKPESSEEAARREIKEETGLKDVRILEKIGRTQYYYRLKKSLRFKTVEIYLCETGEEKLNIQKYELSDGRWFMPKEALETVEYKGSRGLLQKAIDRFAAAYLAITFVMTLFCNFSFADTVYLKDKSVLKGIVIEEYAERITYSMLDGEKAIMKSDIERIEYEERIDNLIHLGDSAFQKGYYRAALKYYLMAQDINPNIRTLNDKVYHAETVVYNEPEVQKRDSLELKNEILGGSAKGLSSPYGRITPKDALSKELGISIINRDGKFIIEEAHSESPFKKAGILKGDILIAVWGELCSYMTFADLYRLLTRPGEAMTAITIERNLKLERRKPLGVKLVMKWEGAVVDDVFRMSVAEKIGIKSGDLIVSVDGAPLRYTPLKAVSEKLNEKVLKNDITIQRKATIFR